ncbi:MAG: hypothetical protein CM15mP109_07880 [Candidatus Dadabacteria bacterium]|nr:MAG: hypothetical protein CM15mP109_07880 [Candidatus Dadabacteria bacterium]
MKYVKNKVKVYFDKADQLINKLELDNDTKRKLNQFSKTLLNKRFEILLNKDLTKVLISTERNIESSSITDVFSSKNLNIFIGSLFLNRSEKL